MITFRHDSKELQKQIEQLLEESGASEIGIVKSKKHEEYFFMTQGDRWLVYIDRAIWPQRYELSHGRNKFDNISMYITLIDFNNKNLRDELYTKFLRIKNTAKIHKNPWYNSQMVEERKSA